MILDDAHTLHPQQFRAMQHWLVRRELRVARWVLTRLDVLHPGEALATVAGDRSPSADLPGVSTRREITEILLQSGVRDRKANRVTFRRIAKDMSERYLRMMPLFNSKHLTSLSSLLETRTSSLAASKCAEINASIESAARQLHVTPSRVASLRKQVEQYSPTSRTITADLRAGMTRILVHRYAKRTESLRNLFDADDDPEPAKPVDVNSAVADAAALHLFHKYDRPYYVGIDDLCDASSENAEQFLRLAAELVEASAAQLVRDRAGALDVKIQHRLLREAAKRMIEDWNFPNSDLVRRLIDRMAHGCLQISLQPNAPLGHGANAFGLPQSEFERLPDKHAELARVLQFAIAYNAITLVPHYECKKKNWCLLELGGIPLLHYGLPLKRGGFIEGSAAELSSFLQEVP